MIQIEERLQKTKDVPEAESTPSLESIVLQSHENSKAVPKALERAEKVQKKCDHLLRTLQTRLELPCHDVQDARQYPRPPQGSQREVSKY